MNWQIFIEGAGALGALATAYLMWRQNSISVASQRLLAPRPILARSGGEFLEVRLPISADGVWGIIGVTAIQETPRIGSMAIDLVDDPYGGVQAQHRPAQKFSAALAFDPPVSSVNLQFETVPPFVHVRVRVVALAAKEIAADFDLHC